MDVQFLADDADMLGILQDVVKVAVDGIGLEQSPCRKASLEQAAVLGAVRLARDAEKLTLHAWHREPSLPALGAVRDLTVRRVDDEGRSQGGADPGVVHPQRKALDAAGRIAL